MMNYRIVIGFLVAMVTSSVIVKKVSATSAQKKLFIGAFVVYLAYVVWITLVSRTPLEEPRVRLTITSLEQIFRIRYADNGSISSVRIGKMYWERRLNILLFIPFGYLLPTVSGRFQKWWKTVLSGVGLSSLIEILQLITLRGWCDLDDLFLNTVGVLIGYGLYWVVLERIIVHGQ